ncbi:geminin isoform X1 [Neodiprion pinetum]|uniref:Geminin isoform X1 n=1 Tax=Neodiprion lecontei TaxID=441921 RepID=A0A6J0C1I5_NEOLC|nr:geminin isoform X1 [Neodiprion lecontei]XP_046410867.1 geminin isoform X1 [Neodiprion fabricii]XP_046410868.1 geminin isoform X1 [Neodiprion fabricii]XP_046466441.1 geminin isoform X1 [Neodiprion pinetum]XP_046466442.1 geminin isoform X1 [Neodiprion pinetum]XP_046586638.1 geminin isoform X1 [Neodiprion lecontei]XP_046604525.1 geminin isoform X1 [Neodiprion virginianus]XP_046604526.1 geminin isoform X1 [Neodiprion virginianus]
MKPEGTTKVSAAKTAASEDTKVRKSLRVLQPAAKDKENLVGAGRTLRSTASAKELLKNEMSEKTAKTETVKRKKVHHKGIQTTQEKIKVSVEDLTSEAGPSENYWEVLAERRRIALEDALEENSALTERIVKLEEENRVCNEMLDETRALVEVLQEMIGEDGNGINNSLDDSAL